MTRLIIVLTICGLQLLTYAVKSQDRDSIPNDWPLSNLYKTNSPLDFLNIIRTDFKRKDKFNVFPVVSSPDNWVKEEHIPDLIKLVYSTDSTKSIVSILSSHLPMNEFSSIGREAQNLIESFKTKKSYPGELNSYGPPDKVKGRELENWWTNYKNRKP